MNEHEPLLTIRFDGEAVGPGRIPVSHLLAFLTNMNKAFQRTGRILSGDAESVRPGQLPRGLSQEVSLELVSLTHGSPSAVLGFERTQPMPCLPGLDLGMEILEKSILGLTAVQNPRSALPAGYDAGVLMAWRDAGKLFCKGIQKIDISLRQKGVPTVSSFTPEGFVCIQERIKGPNINIRTIEGRLMMVDFKEHGTRCRVHPSTGEPIFCVFDEEQKDEVLENILHYVRIVGEAREDAVTGKINGIKIHDIERLEERAGGADDLLPLGTPISRDFWDSPTIEELANAQNVQPMVDVRMLFGTWQGEENDGFESAIDELRHPTEASSRA